MAFHWEAARALVQLVRGNAAEKLKAIFDKQAPPIRGPIMITVVNVIPGGTRIDLAKSPLADLFVAEVLRDRQSFMAMSARHWKHAARSGRIRVASNGHDGPRIAPIVVEMPRLRPSPANASC